MKRNMTSAILALLCAFVLLFSLLPVSSFAAETDTDTTVEGEAETEAAEEPEGKLIIGSEDEESIRKRTITIRSAEEFEDFARNCRSSAWSVGLTVKLQADIDFEGRAIMPIPSFSGKFYGNGYKIENFSCASNGSHQGLFRYVESEGRIVNLKVSGVIAPEGSRCSVGGIVGTNRGSVVSCSFSGIVDGLISVGGIAGENLGTISRCSTEGSVSGKHFTGGICGYNEGTLRLCKNSAEVNIEIKDEAVDIETLDIKDLIGINLVSTEDGNTVSDIGGIVGISLGVVGKCTNNGTVGYQHYGYNIGGIAGRQSGFLEDCVNNAAIFGRKDVGGIVGQMEPYLILDDSSSLVDEIQALQEAMDTAMNDMDANSAALGSSASQVRSSSTNIGTHYANEYMDTQSEEDKAAEREQKRENFQNAVNTGSDKVSETAGDLGEDTIGNMTSGNLTDEDYEKIGTVGTGLVNEGGTALGDRISERREEKSQEELEAEAERARMRAEYASLASGLNTMGRTLHGTMAGLAGDMKNVNDHYSNILTMFTNALSGNLQMRVMEDISDLDTDEDMDGKVLSCTNNGDINGDTDVGGIAGAMSVEAEFDLEGILSANITDTVQISTDSYFARCIVRKCVNNGGINGKKDYTGGICGLAELGVISSAENYGDVSAGGNYCGGVIGQSKSIVTGSYALCAVEGGEYVGGIAGQGKRVTLCSSIVDLDETIACSGAICGWADAADEDLFIYRNTYVSDTLGGIDGISYEGAAEPISYRELYRNEALPERFKSLKVSFRAAGMVIRELTVPYGGSVDPKDIPAVPELHGYSGYWPETNLNRLKSSVTVDAIYLDRLTGLAANYHRPGSPLSVVIIEGLFEPDATVSVAPWKEGVIVPEHYMLLEGMKLNVQSHAADLESYSVHYQVPKTSILRGKQILTVMAGGLPEQREYRVDGSYMIFDATGSELCFYVQVCEYNITLMIWCAAGVALLLLILVIVLIRLIKKRKRRKAAQKQAEAEAAAEAPQEPAEPAAVEAGAESSAVEAEAEPKISESDLSEQ